jgi:hypothetical protein
MPSKTGIPKLSNLWKNEDAFNNAEIIKILILVF